ncbi:MAG TPA: TIGR00266 family protein [Solirubrobacteraceae bacterium]|jgi:uncharacterized protein (TIGR00266 family)|nr:TIGR00266 family protein [Solirubrobacteraceae bacterium]
MKETIQGTTLPVLELQLDPGESVIAESGELSWIDANIELSTSTSGGGSHGLFGAIKRAVGGSTLFMTSYRATTAQGLVAFAAKLPGQILAMDISDGQSFLVHRHGFMCGTDGVTLTTGVQRKLGAGIFGGAGFVMQRVGGNGKAWFELSGELVIYELTAGQSLRIHPGHVGLFEETVTIDFASIPGIRNKLFGDGLFLAQLTGPGKVWLQSLSIANLAQALVPYMPEQSDSGSGAGGIGGLLGGVGRITGE